MSQKQTDEWGVIIKKQLELEKIQNELDKFQSKQKQLNYRQQLDHISEIRNQKKLEEKLAKIKEAEEISLSLEQEKEKELRRKHKNQEISQKIIEENQKLGSMISQEKQLQKIKSKSQDIDMTILENQKILESLQKKQKMKHEYEKTAETDIKFAQVKLFEQKNQKILDKEQEIENIRITQEKLLERDLRYRDYYNRVQENQRRKAEIFNRNIGPKIFEKELNYANWVQHAEEQTRLEGMQKDYEKEQKKIKDMREISQTLKKQSEEKQIHQILSKEQNKAIDEEILRRVDLSFQIDQERNYRKKVELLSYRDQLLMQAQMDKEKKGSELKLSEKEKMMNKCYLENPKNTLRVSANEMLKPNGILLNNHQSPRISPSLKNTTLQLGYAYEVPEPAGSRLNKNRNSIF